MRKKSVLLVDDDPDMIFIVRELLKTMDLEVLTCEDGLDALGILKSKKPDLVVSDVMLPGMDGIEFCESAKRDPETAAIPFFLLTAMNQDKAVPLMRKCGADAFLAKPFEHVEFLTKVRELLK